jgi:hypothetical protein
VCYILHSCTSGAIFIETRYDPLFSTTIVPNGIPLRMPFRHGKPTKCENFFLFELNARSRRKATVKAPWATPSKTSGNPKETPALAKILRGFETIAAKPKAPPKNPNVCRAEDNVDSPLSLLESERCHRQP